MPTEAIATTKRKFHKILDSLTSTAQPLLPSATSNESTSAATAKTGTIKLPPIRPASIPPPGERAAKRLRPSTSTLESNSAVSSTRSRRSIASTSSLARKVPASSSLKVNDEAKDRTPPNFSPWSHETFLARLKTFSSVSLWHPKPEEVGEVVWAKRGWVCVDVNTVGCKGGCEKRVVVKLEKQSNKENANSHAGDLVDEEGDDDDDVDDEAAAFEQSMVDRYVDLIVNGHSENCLWRKAGCKDDIYRLTLVRPSVWQPELRDRYRLLQCMSNAISDISFKSLDTSSSATSASILSPSRLLQDFQAYVLEPPTTTATNNNNNELSEPTKLKALTIALHGWRGTSTSGNDLLHCDACFQRIGLWMYQPDYKQRGASLEAPEDADADADEQRDRVAVVDLVDLHREHCPYRNAATQKASGTLAGLNAIEILLRVVSTFAREQRRKSNEARSLALGDPALLEGEDGAGEGGEGDVGAVAVVESKEEVARLDKERDSRLRKLRKVFTIKRKGGGGGGVKT